MNYWPVDVAAVSVVPGPAGTSSGKSLYCAGGAGAVNCILAGLSSGVLGDGVVARVTVQLALATPDAVSTIGVTGALGAAQDGTAVPVQGGAGIITILQPPLLNGVTSAVTTWLKVFRLMSLFGRSTSTPKTRSSERPR